MVNSFSDLLVMAELTGGCHRTATVLCWDMTIVVYNNHNWFLGASLFVLKKVRVGRELCSAFPTDMKTTNNDVFISFLIVGSVKMVLFGSTYSKKQNQRKNDKYICRLLTFLNA